MGIFVWNYLFIDCLVAIECVDHVSHFIKENFPIIVGCKVHMCSTCGICLHLNLVVVLLLIDVTIFKFYNFVIIYVSYIKYV